MIKAQKAILPFLFYWILLFGVQGLACTLHLCQNGEVDIENSKEFASHTHLPGDEGCCEVISEFFISDNEVIYISGKYIPQLYMASVSLELDHHSFPFKKVEPLPFYEPPSIKRDFHILHQVFII